MDRIAQLLDAALAAHLGSAAAVAVGDAGAEVFQLVRGHARRVPDLGPAIDAEAWFDVASLTKPMATAASAMVLVGERKLALETPIRHWFGEASSTGTVRDLLGHAAGCAAHVEFFRDLRVGAHADPRGELVALAAAEPAQPPGRATVYSDLGYLLLGAIVERAADAPLEEAYAALVAEPLGLRAYYPGTGSATPAIGAVATELDERGLVVGQVHDENAYYGGGVCGHAGLFSTIGDVSRFAAALVAAAAGERRGRLDPEVVSRFVAEPAVPGASWRLGWDTPSAVLGVSHAGDRWPRDGAIGHLGFTGTSLWLDLPRRRWVALLTNRVHPSRAGSAEPIKQLRRAVSDAVVDALAGDRA